MFSWSLIVFNQKVTSQQIKFKSREEIFSNFKIKFALAALFTFPVTVIPTGAANPNAPKFGVVSDVAGCRDDVKVAGPELLSNKYLLQPPPKVSTPTSTQHQPQHQPQHRPPTSTPSTSFQPYTTIKPINVQISPNYIFLC